MTPPSFVRPLATTLTNPPSGEQQIREDGLTERQERGPEMPGKFVIKKGTTGKFRFVLVSPRGQVIATSEPYQAKASAMAGIRSMRKLAPEATIEDLSRPGEPKRKTAAKTSPPSSSPKRPRRVRARPGPGGPGEPSGGSNGAQPSGS